MDVSAISKTSLRLPFSFFAFILIGLSRVTQSIDRLPPDPGYDFFENSYQSGLSVIWRTEGGYVDVPRRVLSEMVILFPIRYSAIIGTLLWAVMAAGAAVAVSWLIGSLAKNHLIGFLCGLLVILNPSASESQIGNQSVIKWFLILLVAVGVSVIDLELIPTYVLAALILICGASNPVTIAAASPLVFRLLTKSQMIRDKRNIIIVGAFVVAFLIQLLAWKSTGSGWRKYSDRVYWPWPGSGFFWSYNFLISPLTFVGIFVVATPVLPFPKPSKSIVNLAVAGLSIWGLPYFMSGMADRYFVVPQILAGICVIAYTKEIFGRKNLLLNAACAVYLVVAGIAMVHWYQSMWFLTSGPQWSTEVDKAVSKCSGGEIELVFIEQFKGGTTINCTALLERT